MNKMYLVPLLLYSFMILDIATTFVGINIGLQEGNRNAQYWIDTNPLLWITLYSLIPVPFISAYLYFFKDHTRRALIIGSILCSFLLLPFINNIIMIGGVLFG